MSNYITFVLQNVNETNLFFSFYKQTLFHFFFLFLKNAQSMLFIFLRIYYTHAQGIEFATSKSAKSKKKKEILAYLRQKKMPFPFGEIQSRLFLGRFCTEAKIGYFLVFTSFFRFQKCFDYGEVPQICGSVEGSPL